MKEIPGKGILKEYDPRIHGVTQSLLAKYLACEKKARYYTQGLTSTHTSGKALVFGSVFHEFQDLVLNVIKSGQVGNHVEIELYVNNPSTQEYMQSKFPPKDEDTMFAIHFNTLLCVEYFKYWNEKYFGENKFEIVGVENSFDIVLPSGIRLRGKMDGILSKDSEYYLLEHKTKSRMDTETIQKTLKINIQCLVYIIACYQQTGLIITKIAYDVIRKPGIRKKNGENYIAFSNRCIAEVKVQPDYYFKMFYQDISIESIDTFYTQLDVLLERYLKWSLQHPEMDLKNTHTCSNMFGTCEYLDYCTSNERDHYTLDINDDLFRELI